MAFPPGAFSLLEERRKWREMDRRRILGAIIDKMCQGIKGEEGRDRTNAGVVSGICCIERGGVEKRKVRPCNLGGLRDDTLGFFPSSPV